MADHSLELIMAPTREDYGLVRNIFAAAGNGGGMAVWYPAFDIWRRKAEKQFRPILVLRVGTRIGGLMVLKPNPSPSQKYAQFPDSGKICAWRISEEVQKKGLAQIMLEHLLSGIPHWNGKAWRMTAPEEFGKGYAKVIHPFGGTVIAAIKGRYRPNKKEVVFMIPSFSQII